MAHKPDFAEALFNCGTALQNQGNLKAAIDYYRRALLYQPDFVAALGNLGNALKNQGKVGEAAACYQRCIEVQPDDAKAYNNLGTMLSEQGQLDEAIKNFDQAIERDPAFAEAYFNLGLAYCARQRFEQAIQCYKKTVELRPTLSQAFYELGNAYSALKENSSAADAYRRALDLNPEYAEALTNLGNLYREIGDLQQAIGMFRWAIDARPDSVQAHNNLANALQECGQIVEAAASFRRAIELAPQQPEPHWNAAMLMLLQGDLERGWPAYEWRWKTGKLTAPAYSQPKWEGESLQGKTILLHAEQGFGDTLQFIRYAPLIKQLGASVVVECQRPLTKLLASCPGIDHLIPAGAALLPFDFHIPLLSIPATFKTTLSTIPHEVPYLFADAALIDHWRDALKGISGFRIGINWRGRAGRIESRKRDIPLHLFASLADIPGVQLISLQKGAGQEDLATVVNRLPIVDLGEFDTDHGAFMDTAAIMKNVDLVISSDTAVPHLAGALGVPVWVALPFVPDWRWLLSRSDSPWYSTMRLFRQKAPGDWNGAFVEMQEALNLRIHLPR